MTTLSTARQARWASRAWIVLCVLLLIAAACGSDAETPTTLMPTDTSTSVAPTATTSPVTTPAPVATTHPPTTAAATQPPPTTTLAPEYSVARHGAGEIALGSSDGQLGSGCSPGPGPLPDGIWFGWIEASYDAGLSFDLACLAPGSPPTATNSNPRLRDVPVAADAPVRMVDGSAVPLFAWAPAAEPMWLYVNHGIATEVAHCTMPVTLKTEASTDWVAASVRLPVTGGCCDSNYNGPASPERAWPATGLPADGAYAVDVTVDTSADDLVLTIRKFVACADHPDMCTSPLSAGDVFVEWDSAIVRRLEFDESLTVRIIGLALNPALASKNGIEGSGTAFAKSLADAEHAWETHIQAELAAGKEHSEVYESLMERGAADPSFPYGPTTSDHGEILVYRGPLGIELVHWLSSPKSHLGATQLETVNGRPVLTIHAAQIAG